MSKVKMLLDVVDEVKKEAPQDVPNWNSKFAEAKVNLQNQITKGRLLHSTIPYNEMSGHLT